MWEYITEKLDGSLLFALAVISLVLGFLANLMSRSGVFGAKKSVENGDGAGAPAAIKAALDELVATNKQVAASNDHLAKAKEAEIKAVERMASKVDDLGGILAASNRLADETNKFLGDAEKDSNEMLRLFQRNMEMFTQINMLVTQMVQAQNTTNERLNNVAHGLNNLSARMK